MLTRARGRSVRTPPSRAGVASEVGTAARAVLLGALVGVAALGALASIASLPAIARAEPTDSDEARKDQARALAVRGDSELDAGKFTEAESTFREALALVDAPTLRVRLARALVGQGRLVEARRAYLEVAGADLGPKPPGPFVEAVAEAKAEAEALKKRVPVIRIGKIAGRSSGAVRVDDHETTAGADVEVDPGKHRITGEGAAPRSIDIAEGEQVTVDLAQDGVPFPWRTTSTPVFVLAGIGLFGLGMGAGWGIDAIAQKAELDEACGPEGRCAPEFRNLHDAYVTSSIVSTTSIAIGGAAIVTGVIVFAIGKPLGAGGSSADEPTMSIGPSGASARVPW